MICNRDILFEEKCTECEKKFLVIATTANGGEDLFLCFDTEQEAKEVWNSIEATNEYLGTKTRPKTAILLHPEK